MRRRAFIAGLAEAVAWPAHAHAQQAPWVCQFAPSRRHGVERVSILP
jgi:hypothetical protein